jgi:DNA repair exonuclease SbcCD ATPase subunit
VAFFTTLPKGTKTMSTELTTFISETLTKFQPDQEAVAALSRLDDITLAVDGYDAVKAARKDCTKIRTAIDKRRKELNEGALAYQRAINAEAKRLTELVQPIEGRLRAEEETHEEEIAKAELAVQQEKSHLRTSRLEQLAAVGCIAYLSEPVENWEDGWFLAVLKKETEKFEERQAEERVARERAEELQRQHEAVQAELTELRKLKAEKEQQEIERESEARAAELRAAEAARNEELKPVLIAISSFFEAMQTDLEDELKCIGNPWWGNIAHQELQEAASEVMRRVKAGERE